MSARPRLRTVTDWAVILLFLAAIWLPLTGTFFHGRFNKAANDMRALASLPELRLKGSVLKAFPEKFNQYWSDNFGFRGTLIRFLNVAKVRWLRVSTSAYVLLGQAPWLFYTPHQAGTNYNGVRPFTVQELNDWQRVLEQRRHWLEQRGCRYLLFIPPDKQTIYPEYLDPVFLTRHDQSRLDQLMLHLRDHHSPVKILDVRQPMLAAKARERLYHRTDAHWNDRGAFIGYQHLTGTLSKSFPSIQPWSRSDFEEATMDRPGGDLATMIYLADVAHEEWLNLLPRRPRFAHTAKEGVGWPKEKLEETFPLGKPFATECDNPRLPRAVMFHDSFCLAMQPFLSEHFRRIAYVWHDDFFPAVIENERPEVVIQELLERKLTYVKPKPIGATQP
jgi:hypothetical protein